MNNKTTYCQRNRETILNRAKEYYENNKERLREKAWNNYRELSEEEEHIKGEYGRIRYQNMSEENKQRLKEYQKKLLWSKKIKINFFDFFSCIYRKWKRPWLLMNNVLIRINFIRIKSQLVLMA